MAEYEEFEEEEFTTQFNGGTLARILGQVKPHWRWVAGFMVSIALVSSLDSVFTYQSKRIIDEAIVPQNPAALPRHPPGLRRVDPGTVRGRAGLHLPGGCAGRARAV